MNALPPTTRSMRNNIDTIGDGTKGNVLLNRITGAISHNVGGYSNMASSAPNKERGPVNVIRDEAAWCWFMFFLFFFV